MGEEIQKEVERRAERAEALLGRIADGISTAAASAESMNSK